MRVEYVDLFSYPGDIGITTNGIVKNNGRAVMGAGVAKEIKKLVPDIDLSLGKNIDRFGNVVSRIAGPGHKYPFDRNVISFPVKYNWWEKASVDLIELSCLQLTIVLEAFIEDTFYLPKPGCGNGGLSWSTVEPVLDRHLSDYDVIIVDWNPYV